MTAESPEVAAVQLAGASVVSSLFGLVKALSLYELNNEAVAMRKKAIADALALLARTSRDGLKLTLLSEEFFVNGRLLRIAPAMYERGTTLSALLSEFAINEIGFAPGCRPEHLDPFVADLAQSIRTKRGVMRAGGYPGIAIAQTKGRSVASLRFDPRRLAIWLYSTLLDQTERLEHEQEEEGRVLAVRRTLQLIIDNMQGHTGIYQALTAVQDWQRPLPLHRRRVATAVDAIGFGLFIGLDRPAQMTLALAALVEGLGGATTDPRQAVAAALRLDGLGPHASAVVLAVHDAAAARTGQPSGVPGRMLAVVSAYHEDLAKGPQARSPHVLLKAMAQGRLAGRDRVLESLFAAYKGPFPLGSAVQFGNGAVAAVVAQPDTLEGKRRPTVALFAPGRPLGDPLDLRSRPDLEIWGEHPPARLHFDLSAV